MFRGPYFSTQPLPCSHLAWPARRPRGAHSANDPAASSGRRPKHRRGPENQDKLFTFTRLPQSQWKSARTTNAIERLNEGFRRRVKTQTVLPCAETVPMLLWALMASGQSIMRRVDGRETLGQPVTDATLDQAA